VPTVTPSVLTLAMWIGLGGVAGCDRPPEPEEDSWLDRTVRAGGAPRHWPRRGVEATLPSCPTDLRVDTAGWQSVIARYAPIQFRLPPGYKIIALPVGAIRQEVWRGHFEYELVRAFPTRVRFAASPYARVVLRCGERISGRDAAVVLWRTAWDDRVGGTLYGGDASLVLRPGVELRLRGRGGHASVPQDFLTTLRTLRVLGRMSPRAPAAISLQQSGLTVPTPR
jgi:hypothetical protein